ncbi:MAG: carbohydrate ABC transporter permease [Anaerolineae bacterium]|nr:carbohydrate ABC transporter permease [Anaerolineae bacterium]NUQ06175.1 carbohydrate ABC transporter permease [Anaerolineae bacterium]
MSALLILLAIPFVFPFWWMVSSAFKQPGEIFAYPPTLLPTRFSLDNFVEVFTYQPFAQQYLNSLLVAIMVTVGTLIVSSLAGYGFARIKFPGRTVLFLMLLSALMLPSEVTIIPNFFFMKSLNLTNTHIPLIVLPIFGAQGVIGTFMIRQFFLSLPKEIEEAGLLDGASRWGLFWHIALPIARPVLGGLSILAFLYSWNLFLEPLVFIDDVNMYTLPLSLRNYNDVYGTPLWHLQLAATTLAVIPVLIVYVIGQRQIIDSFASSGVKG